MGLAYNKVSVFGSTMWSYIGGTRSDLFRLASGWLCSRDEMLRLINGFMSGPSTTAETDMSADRAMFFRPLQYRVRLRNATNLLTHYRLYKCTLKYDDIGGTPSGYVEANKLPMTTGPANFMGTALYSDTGNYPGSRHWRFWMQRDRFGGTSAQQRTVAPYMPFTTDAVRTQNNGLDGGQLLAPTGDDVVAAASGLTAHGCWEMLPDGTAPDVSVFPHTQHANRHLPLTTIFPYLTKQCSVRCVSRGTLTPFGSRSLRFRHRMPRTIKPLRYILNDVNVNALGAGYYKGLSHFFFIRAWTEAPTSLLEDADSDNVFMSQFVRFTPQIICDWERKFECRVMNDALPNYTVAYDSYVDPANPRYWLGPNNGGFRNGFRYVDSTTQANAQTVSPVDEPESDVITVRAPTQHFLKFSSGLPTTLGASNPVYQN